MAEKDKRPIDKLLFENQNKNWQCCTPETNSN